MIGAPDQIENSSDSGGGMTSDARSDTPAHAKAMVEVVLHQEHLGALRQEYPDDQHLKVAKITFGEINVLLHDNGGSVTPVPNYCSPEL